MKLNINGKEIEVANEEISKAIEEGKESFEIKSDLSIRTAEEESTFVENLKSGSNTAAYEIGRKNVLKGLGIEVEGQHKSDEAAINAVKSFLDSSTQKAIQDAKIDPNKKVEEMTKDINTLRSTIETLQGEKKSIAEEFSGFKQNSIRKNTLSSLIPDNTLNDKKTTMLIMEAQLKTGFSEDGKMFGIGADGQPLKDPTTLSILPMEDVVTGFFNDNPHLLKTASGGAGGGDSASEDGRMTLETFTKQQNEAGNATNGAEFVKNMTAAIQAGTLSV